MISITFDSLYIINPISHFDDGRGIWCTTICATLKSDRFHLDIGLTLRWIWRITRCHNCRVLTFSRRGLCEVKHVDTIVNNLSIDIVYVSIKIKNIQIVLITYEQITTSRIQDFILDLRCSSRALFGRTIDIVVLIKHIALIHAD